MILNKNLMNTTNEAPNFYLTISNHKYTIPLFLVVIFLTIIGNLMVILAIKKNSFLQNRTNYFLMSLAIADFLVAIIVMPLGFITEILGKHLTLKIKHSNQNLKQ